MREQGRSEIGSVLIEPLERGSVRLWVQLGADGCLRVESGSPEWSALWAGAGVELPCDTDAGADLGEAIHQLRGRVIELGAVAA